MLCWPEKTINTLKEAKNVILTRYVNLIYCFKNELVKILFIGLLKHKFSITIMYYKVIVLKLYI